MQCDQEEPHETHMNCQNQCPETSSAVYLNLDTLPSELIMHICSFLEAKVIIQKLSMVCKSFYELLSHQTFWKIRLRKYWPKKYPPVPVNDSEFNWRTACMHREEHHKNWDFPSVTMDHFTFTEGLYASVDAVHLMNNGSLLAAGSRDRYLNILDLTKYDALNPESNKEMIAFSKLDAHKGWIWSMSSVDNILATGSWDAFIKFWDLAAGGEVARHVQCKSAILSTHYENNFMAAGGYDKKVYHIDPRVASIICEKRYHKRPVLSLVVDDKFIITGSEDATVCVFDRVANKPWKTIKVDPYPMCMSYGQGQLWIGDKQGGVKLLDTSDGDFTCVQYYESWHTGKVTGLVHDLGTVVTCSTDGTIQVREPTVDPDITCTLCPNAAEVAKISFQNNVLACACSGVAVGIWKPREAAC